MLQSYEFLKDRIKEDRSLLQPYMKQRIFHKKVKRSAGEILEKRMYTLDKGNSNGAFYKLEQSTGRFR